MTVSHVIILLIGYLGSSISKKPHSKHQQYLWRLECELGVIADSECPLDGGWAPWGPWSTCHGSCDDIGHRTRTRQCNNPPPSRDGLPCSGQAEQTEPCYLRNCSVKHFQQLVHGDSSRLRALRQLEAVPALIERCLQMQCPFEAIEAALSADNTWQLNPEALWNALQCVKHNLGCPVNGEWSPWGQWSSCGARCGSGFMWRLRHCDNPPPSNDHLTCSGSPLQAKKCEGDQCLPELKREKKRLWSEWGQWTKCSEKCGFGVRRRKRICNELYQQRSSGFWGTSCRGQYDQVDVCNYKVCVLDGRWSGWSAWGPCSQSCGAGRRSRTRSCTRPAPAGGGQDCVGSRTEIGSCHFTPCEVFSHTVAVLNGESQLQYKFDHKRSALLHFYIRFMPLSPHGTLIRRGIIHGSHVRLSLQKWHACLDVSGSSRSCDLPRICTTETLEPAIWHTALITITSEAATLRLDDSYIAIRGTFPCDPELPIEPINIIVGERLHGEIQEIIVNFIPLRMMIDRERKSYTDLYPSYVSNVAYEKSNMEEAYLNLDNEQYLRVPCFDYQNEWRLRLTVKSKRESGTLLFLQAAKDNRWLHLDLQNLRLKLKLADGNSRTESSSSSESPLDQWLDVELTKQKGSNAIEASINSGERLHVFFGDVKLKKRKTYKITTPEEFEIFNSLLDSFEDIYQTEVYNICNDEFYLGGVPADVKNAVSEDFASFHGIIASLSINGVLSDLHRINVEKQKDGQIQLSSRTASVSGSYYETTWSDSNKLNLTCLHTRSARSPHSAHWLFLDTTVTISLGDKKVRSLDDGRVLRLVASADNDLRGFYTCRAHSNKRTRNVVTYGVIGKIQYRLTGPDVTTLVAVFTTVTLVVGTLLWLVIEGIHDLRNGYGFFRDAHLTPEEEAEAVCKFIDDNLRLIDSNDEAKIAKAKARSIGQELTNKYSFVENDTQNLVEEQECSPENEGESTHSEPDTLPALPEIKTSFNEQFHNVYVCDPCYISSPRHGSVSSTKSKLTSSLDSTPRFLCSNLLTKRNRARKENTILRKKNNRSCTNLGTGKKMRTSNLLTIKSSTYMNLSPAQKVIQKFEQLKRNDRLE